MARKPLPTWVMRRLVEGLLYYGHTRGPQSSGAFLNGRVFKRAMPADKLILEAEFEELFQEEATVALTHNRFPTTGGREDRDAHPFAVGDTVLVHNGSLVNPEALVKSHGLVVRTEVDSEVLPALLDKVGPKGMASIYSKEARGSAAIAALHKGRLYVARDCSPLEYFTMTVGEENDLCIFGSTCAQVMQAVRHVWLMNEAQRTTSLDTGKMFTMSYDGPQEEVGKFCTAGYSTYTPPASSYGRTGMTCWSEGGHDNWRTRNTSRINGEQTSLLRLPAPKDVERSFVDPEVAAAIERERQAIIKDESVLVPSHPLGYGWKPCVTVGPDGRRQWMYCSEYAAKQRIKFPPPVQQYQESGGKKGGKLDRNRNAEKHKQKQAGPSL